MFFGTGLRFTSVLVFMSLLVVGLLYITEKDLDPGHPAEVEVALLVWVACPGLSGTNTSDYVA